MLVAVSMQLRAQTNVHEFSISGGGGLSTLVYKPPLGKSNVGAGGDLGFGYTFARARVRATETGTLYYNRYGFHTGFGLALYCANAQIASMSYTADKLEKDSDGDEYELTTTISGYKESQKTVYLNIPVMGEYQAEPFYVMAGFKFGIPVYGRYEINDATLALEAYYPEYDAWARRQEWAGLGKYTKSPAGDLNLAVNVMLAFEAGFKFRTGRNTYLYFGAYLDYGLNDVVKENNLSPVIYDNKNPSDFTTSSVITTFSEKTRIMAAGVKLRLALSK